jgi:hypothetical protein
MSIESILFSHEETEKTENSTGFSRKSVILKPFSLFSPFPSVADSIFKALAPHARLLQEPLKLELRTRQNPKDALPKGIDRAIGHAAA